MLALDGYWTKEQMAGLKLSWVFSIDRTHEMHAGCIARVIVLGECLCIYSLADWREAGELWRTDSPIDRRRHRTATRNVRVGDAPRGCYTGAGCV